MTASVGAVDTLACDICGNAVGDYDVQRFRITLAATGEVYEIDLCKNDRGMLDPFFTKGRLKTRAGRGPRAVPASQPPRDGPVRLRRKPK